MTHLTWGISIPGYSYPSAAQKKLFNKLYPGAAAAYHEEDNPDLPGDEEVPEVTSTYPYKPPAPPFTALDFGPDIDRSRAERHKRYDEIGQLNKELKVLRKEYRKRKAEINKKIEALDY